MKIIAPGVIKLFGEHAVVYGKSSLALAISKYAACVSKSTRSGSLRINLCDLGNMSMEFDEKELRERYEAYRSRKGIGDYTQNSGVAPEFLPFATIASRLMGEHGVAVLNREIMVRSEIPPKTGLASSAACFTAFACALSGSRYGSLSDAQLIDVARDGERVAHVNEGAGSIDTSASFYGGYVTFGSERGAEKEDISTMLDLILVNTGPKLSTAETVGHVSQLYKSDRSRVERIFDEINRCTLSGEAALKKGDLFGVGRCMFRNHELLQKLEVSNENLDMVVELSKANGALGAKLSGGGGGGMAVVLPEKDGKERLMNAFSENGFEAFQANPSLIGAASSLKNEEA